jgi:type I restriction enzyme M protein
MGFLTDAPKSVNRMIVVMRDLGQYRYDVSDVFRDLVDFATACLLVDGDKQLAAELKEKYGKDYPTLVELYRAWVLTMEEQLKTKEWFDAFGVLYEYLASQSKKSYLGQFFTPPDLCDLLTQLTYGGQDPIKGKRINDPACGSARTLLSFNAANPGNYLYGEDLDPICAKMSAVNMAIHGCQGQVTCMNSLSQEFKFCYQINPAHRFGSAPVPHLVPVSKEHCYSLLKPAKDPEPATVEPVLFEMPAIERAASKSETITPARPKKAQKPQSGQLTIF